MEHTDKENKYLRAKERVDRIKIFNLNLALYVLIITGLAVLNYSLDQWHYMWFLWAALGWAIGLLLHWMYVCEVGFFNTAWEKRKIQEFMNDDESASRWE